MTPSQLVDNFFQRLQAGRLLGPQERVLVALSGGSDSVALLYLLHAIAPRLNLSLSAAHLDHGIRAESCDDVAFVRALCDQLQIPLRCEGVDVPALARQAGVGLEEAGRLARQTFLVAEATRLDCTAIALGHHRGDQAETLLHHLGRGCGLHGLAAMRSRRGLFVRPLLDYSKAELLDYLAGIGARFVVDSSNDELIFTRNRIRHQLLPLFAALNPQIETTLAALAGIAGQEDDYWRQEIAALDARLVSRDGDELRLNISALRELHPALRFRFLHHLLTPFAQDREKEVGLGHVETLDRLLLAAAPQGEVHLPGVRAIRRYDELYLRIEPFPAVSSWSLEISGPGLYPFPGGGDLRVEVAPAATGESNNAVEFAADALSFPLILRSVQPGDRIRLPGMTGRKRLKELMMERKIPLEERRMLCVLEEKDEILWFVGIRRSALRLPQAGRSVWRVLFIPHKSFEFPQTP